MHAAELLITLDESVTKNSLHTVDEHFPTFKLSRLCVLASRVGLSQQHVCLLDELPVDVMQGELDVSSRRSTGRLDMYSTVQYCKSNPRHR